MNTMTINGAQFRDMVLSGAVLLEKNKKAIDSLNVFPVPDGDTGTNMSLTLASATREINQKEYLNAGEAAAALAYAGGSLGVVLAGDWLTLIFFWEFMAISSAFLIWFRKSPQAVSAGFRYLLVHFLGGNLLLAGIFLKVSAGQTAITALTGTMIRRKRQETANRFIGSNTP